MSDVPETRTRFLAALAAPGDPPFDADTASNALRRALLDYASETPDNLACSERIEIAVVGDEVGLKLRDRDALFSDIAHLLEELPAPAAVTARFGGLTQAEWDAFTRMTTLIYSAFGRRTASHS